MTTTSYTTTYGTTIPAATIAIIARALLRGDDWQLVADRHLGHIVGTHDEDIEEINEVLREAETYID